MTPSFHIENFGCRAARADGEAVAALLRKQGASESPPAAADVVIVNTCSVTAEADREARAFIRRAHRQNPETRIIVTGCYAQRAPDELAALPGIAAVVGNSHKALTPEIALNLRPVGSESTKNLIQIQPPGGAAAVPKVLVDDTFAHSFLEEAAITPGAQTRPNLKIQEGCSNRCSFCVIPQTRGHSRSLPSSAVLKHVHAFVESGGNELVLSGINLGRWGRDLERTSSEPCTLAALVRAIFDQTTLPRLRLSSIEPMDWDADLISVVDDFAGTRLARHAHLPLQSGSDSVLRRMHRRYRPWHYAEKVAGLIRAAGPALTIGADVMVGFPGETEREFRESYDFIRSLSFGYLHLFPFSPRPGTRAWTLHAENPVAAAVVNERMVALRALAAEKTRAHRSEFIETNLDAITLHTPPALADSGCTSAVTDNFIPVELTGSLQANRLLPIRITGIAPDNTLLARAVPSTHSANSHSFNSLIQPSEPILETAF